jgi:peptide chain release factor 2
MASDTATQEQEVGEARRRLACVTDLYQQNVASTTPLDQLEGRLADLEREQSNPAFWDDSNNERATTVNTQLSMTMRLIQRLQDWQQWHEDAQTSLELAQEETDETECGVWWAEFEKAVASLQDDSEAYELELLLAGPYDGAPARLVLTAGAGGTEANDWVADLKRMYERHCANRGYTIVVEDEQPGDVVGYKSVEMLISGPNAYGWLQGEKGAHRLVRLSPFNANNKRQTTFAGVDVAPDVLQHESLNSMDIPDSELEITAIRSGGKGGQNVNKVSSAVRIKHLPSGLQVKCTQERSQSRNKNIALNRLKAQLLAIVQEQQLADYQQIRGDMVEASWGAQIRNYVLHPYKLVKDQRTGWETANTQAFLDGELLDDCIGAYLRHKAQKKKEEEEEQEEYTR